jgi:archaellum component FlaC
MKSLFSRRQVAVPPPLSVSARDALVAEITIFEREREDLALLVRAGRRDPQTLEDCNERLAVRKAELSALDASAAAVDRLAERSRTELPRLEDELAALYVTFKPEVEALRQKAAAISAKHAQIIENFGHVYHSGAVQVRGLRNFELFSICGGVARLGEALTLWLNHTK